MKASFFRLLVCLFPTIAVTGTAADAVVPGTPEVRVSGWELTLFASEPEIVTPVGIAVDQAGRVFVTESHTHLVKSEYQGPKTDRIVILEDTNGDGAVDRKRIFAEGFTAAMNLQFDPDSVLHMVHRNGVVRLEDADHDGVCERQVPLLTLKTKAVYPHNGLSSLVFAPDGCLYIGSGENFGETCTATAADGSSVSWTPGGANILRLRRDGSKLERWATGLWNCFALTVDGAGRLLAADNDPDSRSPCRLLHIVEGGDYGFRFQYGRSGLHPFVSWNGELPGTLPMIVSTGEAPTSILDARLTALGPERGDGFMVSEWGDSALSWYRLHPRGASFGASREEVIKGQAEFRPVCLAPAPDGSVYLTDWADREYPVHGKGRIWHLKARLPDQTSRSRCVVPIGEPERRRARLAGLMEPRAWPELKTALTDADPWIADAVRTALSRPVFQQRLLAEVESTDPALRLEVLLVLHRAGYAAAEAEPLLRRALADKDAAVRRLALRWAAELRLKALRPLVEKAWDAGRESGQPIVDGDFSLWLATMDLISRDAPPTAATALASNDDLLQRLLADPSVTPAIKATALPRLTNFKAPATIRTLIRLSAEGDPRVREEAVRSLGFVTVKAAVAPLQRIALDATAPVPLRLNAVGSLAGRDDAAVLPLLPLLSGEDVELALETARALRTHISHPKIRAAYTATASRSGTSEGLKAQAALALGASHPSERSRSDAEWTAILLDAAVPADVDRGRRVFFSPAAQCSTCHAAEGRGVSVGPDLSLIARSSNREKLIQSILEPSREISPLHMTRAVTLKNGTLLSGVPSSISTGGNLTLLQAGGAAQEIPRSEVVKVEDTAISLMPEALEGNLTLQDFRDLLAYLLALK